MVRKSFKSHLLRGACRSRWRHSLHLAGVAVATAPLLFLEAAAQTTLPDINVIAPTPVSSPRSAKRKATLAAPRAQRVRRRPYARTARTTGCAAARRSQYGSGPRERRPRQGAIQHPGADFGGFRPHESPSCSMRWRVFPGVSLSDQSGNPFQRDLNYRGFSASPVPGTPQGHRGLPERRAHQRSPTATSSTGTSSRKWRSTAFAGAQQSDLRPQCHRRRPDHRDEERLHLSGQGGPRRWSAPTAGVRPAPRSASRTAICRPTRRRCHQRQRVARLLVILAAAPHVCRSRRPQRRRPNSTSTSPAPTTSSAPSPRPRSRCSTSAGRASTRGRRPRISSSRS